MTKTVLLGDVAEIKMGQSPPSSTYNAKKVGLPFMQGVRTFGDKTPTIDTWCSSPTKVAEKGEVLVSVRAPVGEINIAPEEMCIGRGLASISGRNNQFLYYILLANKKKLSDRETGTVFGSIDRDGLKNLPLNIPETEATQDEIAKILGDLDAKIELNRRTNETLEKIGQALFEHYFIDNPDRKNWEIRTLGEFFPIKTGKKDANFGTLDGKYPFFTCAQDISRAPDFSFDSAALLLAGNGDFSLKLYRGKFEAYQRTYVLVPHKPELLGLLYFLMNDQLSRIIAGFSGSVIHYLTKGMIENYKIRLPEDPGLIATAQEFDSIISVIERNDVEINILTNLRDLLLPRLISGGVAI